MELYIFITIAFINSHFYGLKTDCYIDWNLQNGCLSRIIARIDKREHFPDNASIVFINSSSVMHSLLLEIYSRSVCRIDSSSILSSQECIIVIMKRNEASVFLCEGEVKAERLSLLSSYSMGSLFDPVDTHETISGGDYSSVMVKRSFFRDVLLCSFQGGLITGRGIKWEGVIGCSFSNVSIEVEEGKRKRDIFRRQECVIRDSLVISGENAI